MIADAEILMCLACEVNTCIYFLYVCVFHCNIIFLILCMVAQVQKFHWT